MHKTAKKDERKTQSQISCHYTPSCSMVKIGRLNDSFLTASKPGRRPITAAKRKAKEKKERGKKPKFKKF